MIHIALLVLASTPLLPQQVTRISASYRDGQTFLTWKEVGSQNAFYKVYRYHQPIIDAADLDAADHLGTLDSRSSINHRREAAEGGNRYWIIEEGANPLRPGDGLFVHTIERSEPAWYAVTVVLNGSEDKTMSLGQNSTTFAVEEFIAPTRAVYQDFAGGLLYAHWGGDRDTPYQPAMSKEPSTGFNFKVNGGTTPGARGLLMRLHAAGETYSAAFPTRGQVPQDVDILSMDDFLAGAGWSFWFGVHEEFPETPSADTLVRTYTLRRMEWTMDFVGREQGEEHDPGRIYVVGGSLGGIGSMLMANEFPERIAGIFCRNGNFDFTAGDLQNPDFLENVFGDFDLNLMTDEGIPVFDRTNAAKLAKQQRAVDWPVIRTINGRNDAVTGWNSTYNLVNALAETKHAAIHYYDEREHGPRGTWAQLDLVLIQRMCKERSDRAVLRFSALSLDEDIGNGSSQSGATVGTVNGRIEQDPDAVVETETSVDFSFFLRDENLLDDANAEEATVQLTPRRRQMFLPTPGKAVLFRSYAADELRDEHLLFVDDDGLFETPPTVVTKTPRTAHFEYYTTFPAADVISAGFNPLDPSPPDHRLEFFVGDAPETGQDLQYVVFGEPGQPFAVAVSVGTASMSTSLGELLLARPFVIGTGILDENGIGNVFQPLSADSGLEGVTLHFQALVEHQLSELRTITVQ